VGWLGSPAAPPPLWAHLAVQPFPPPRSPSVRSARVVEPPPPPPGGARLSAAPPPKPPPSFSLFPLPHRARLLLPRVARFPLPLHLAADQNRPLDAGLAPRGKPPPSSSPRPSPPSLLRGAVRPGVARPWRPQRGAPTPSPAWRGLGAAVAPAPAPAHRSRLPPSPASRPRPGRPWRGPCFGRGVARPRRPRRVRAYPSPASACPSSSLRSAVGASARPDELPCAAMAPAPGPGIPPRPRGPAWWRGAVPCTRVRLRPGVVVAPSFGAAEACSPLRGLELGQRVARAFGPGVCATRSRHVSARVVRAVLRHGLSCSRRARLPLDVPVNPPHILHA
jgi:hypothetical protein